MSAGPLPEAGRTRNARRPPLGVPSRFAERLGDVTDPLQYVVAQVRGRPLRPRGCHCRGRLAKLDQFGPARVAPGEVSLESGPFELVDSIKGVRGDQVV